MALVTVAKYMQICKKQQSTKCKYYNRGKSLQVDVDDRGVKILQQEFNDRGNNLQQVDVDDRGRVLQQEINDGGNNLQQVNVDARGNSLQKVNVDDVPQQEDVVAEQEET